LNEHGLIGYVGSFFFGVFFLSPKFDFFLNCLFVSFFSAGLAFFHSPFWQHHWSIVVVVVVVVVVITLSQQTWRLV
jgi:hypothetical protein